MPRSVVDSITSAIRSYGLLGGNARQRLRLLLARGRIDEADGQVLAGFLDVGSQERPGPGTPSPLSGRRALTKPP